MLKIIYFFDLTAIFLFFYCTKRDILFTAIFFFSKCMWINWIFAAILVKFVDKQMQLLQTFLISQRAAENT